MKYVIIYLLIINVVTFLLYGFDKWRAKRDKWRVPEKTLLLMAAIGGSIGAFAGMQVFRHKTKHLKFVIGVPVIFILQVALVWFICFRK